MTQKPIKSLLDLEYPEVAQITITIIETKYSDKVIVKAGEITCEIGEILNVGDGFFFPQRDGVRLPGGRKSWTKALYSILGTTCAISELVAVANFSRKISRERFEEKC